MVNSNLIIMNNFVGFLQILRVKYLFIFSLSGWNKFLMEAQYKVLCVCLGNICRSPTAEVVFRHYCDQHQLNIIVDSAGTSNYHPNKAPDQRSQLHVQKEAMTYLLCGQDNFQLKTF